MTKNYIPTINISSLIKNNFETRNAFETIKKIEYVEGITMASATCISEKDD